MLFIFHFNVFQLTILPSVINKVNKRMMKEQIDTPIALGKRTSPKTSLYVKGLIRHDPKIIFTFHFNVCEIYKDNFDTLDSYATKRHKHDTCKQN